MELPKRTCARIVPRSGLTSKKTINVGGGVIVADYTGEVNVILINQGTQGCLIPAGERMTQIILETISTGTAFQVKHIRDTNRETQGFGSRDLDPK